MHDHRDRDNRAEPPSPRVLVLDDNDVDRSAVCQALHQSDGAVIDFLAITRLTAARRAANGADSRHYVLRTEDGLPPPI